MCLECLSVCYVIRMAIVFNTMFSQQLPCIPTIEVSLLTALSFFFFSRFNPSGGSVSFFFHSLPH